MGRNHTTATKTIPVPIRRNILDCTHTHGRIKRKETMPTGHHLTQEQIDYIRTNFADKTNYQLCEEAGVSRSTVCRLQKIYHLRKSDQHIHNMGVKAGKASDKARGGIPYGANTPESIAKRAETYKKTYQAELIRHKWGLEQKTNIRIPKVCRRARDQKRNLINRGYIIDDAKKIAYYTPGTHRSTRLERIKRGETKGRFRTYYDFRPYAEGQQMD